MNDVDDLRLQLAQCEQDASELCKENAALRETLVAVEAWLDLNGRKGSVIYPKVREALQKTK
jgi:hypothetical protein